MQEKIFTICETLSKVGINPTAERVRAELGGGSFTKISPIIKEWRGSQKKIEPVPEIPSEALKAVHQATALIWSIANDHQIEAINAIKQEYSKSEQQAVIERDEALKEIAFLETQIQSIQASVEALEARNINITTEKQVLEMELQKQRLTLDSVSLANEELKAEIRELHKKAEKSQSQASKEKNALELQLEKQNLIIATLTETSEQLQAESQEQQKQGKIREQEAEKEKRSLELQVQKQQLALDSLENSNSGLKAENKELKKQADIAKNEASKLAGMLEAFNLSKPAIEQAPKPTRKPTTPKAKANTETKQ
jgi:chromosome segregation ATPase